MIKMIKKEFFNNKLETKKQTKQKVTHATLDRFFGRTAPPPKSRRSSPRPREKKD